jgi:germination protein M
MKPTGPLVLVVALVTLLAACGSASGTLGPVPSAATTPSPSVGPTDPDLTPAPSVTPSSSIAPSGSPQASEPANPQGTSIVRAYFYLGGAPGSAGLVAVLREVPETKAVATAAMTALLAGPSAAEGGERTITSAIPAGSRLIGLTIKDGVATVDLSSEFESGGGSASAIIRLGQVVYTLTQFPTVESVLFQIEGRQVTVFGSEGVVLDGPIGRAKYTGGAPSMFEGILPSIFVDRPAYGAALGNPGRVSGVANVFEATFRIALLDGAGNTIVDQMAMATCGSGCLGTFDETLRYDVPKAQWGTLRVYFGSAKDGSPQDIRDYPVWLTPAG